MAHDYKNISKEALEKHLDNIISISNQIKLGEVTILTGGNALGKSVIRKCMYARVKQHLKDLGEERDDNHIIQSISMELRCANRPEWGAMSTAFADMSTESTSDHSFCMLKSLLNWHTEDVKKKSFIVIDELEIGMSKEVIAGTCLYINKLMHILRKNTLGILIITYSDILVQNIEHDKFINIEGMTEKEWINREIVPVDPLDLDNWSMELFCVIRDRQNKNREK